MASTQRTSAIGLTNIIGSKPRANVAARHLACAVLAATLMAPLVGAPVLAQQAATPTEQAQPAQKAAKAAKKKPATKEAKAKTEKKDPAAAQQQIDAGIASLNAGKAEVAVQHFTSALTGGNLPSNLMARAQYQRGLAYRKLAKPALAISDLTQALWLKNGLNETERADALQNRIAAYRDAGLPDQDDGAGATAKSAPVRTAQADTAAPVSSTSSIGSSKTPAGFAPAPESQPAAGGGGIGNFFGNLFGGSSAAPQQAAAAAAPPARQEAAVSAWSANTEVKSSGKAARAPAAVTAPAPATEKLPWEQPASAAAPPAPGKQIKVASAAGAVAAPVKAASGQYRLQVGQLKSEQDAQALVARLKQQFAADLGGREASVTAVSAGGFGTLHRVTFGPFRDPSEWKTLCPKLLGAGQDCQPVTQ